MPNTINPQLEAAVSLIKAAPRIVALTGAGISTPSGIPDFRSPGSGLWQKFNPMEVASIIAFRQNPAGFYAWVRPLAQTIFNAEPNAAHRALAKLEAHGKLATIITQNIDGLHQAADSAHVLEVHGHTREVTCVRCYKTQPARPALEKFMKTNKVPTCECGGTLKPNVILFGEQLPVQPMVEAKSAMREADLVLVIGSSLEVAPISDLPRQAIERGAKVIIINLQPTHLDAQAEVVIHREIIDVLPQIVEAVVAG